MPRRFDLLAAHMAALDPDTERARERLDREVGPALARLLVAGLSKRSVTGPLARRPRVAVAAAAAA
jgi:hypothetical protein